MNKSKVITKMVDFLKKSSNLTNSSLKGINFVNYQRFLDKRIGACAREKFEDMANDCFIGIARTTKQEDRAIECIEGALQIIIEENYKQEKKKWFGGTIPKVIIDCYRLCW